MGCHTSQHMDLIVKQPDDVVETKQQPNDINIPKLSSLEVAEWQMEDAHRKAGRLAFVIQLAREAVELFTHMYGTDHSITGRAQHRLAKLLGDVKKHHEAVDVARASIVTLTKSLGPHAHLTVIAKSRLAAYLFGAGHYEEAQLAGKEAVELCETVFGHKHPKTQEVIMCIEILNTTTRKLDTAPPVADGVVCVS